MFETEHLSDDVGVCGVLENMVGELGNQGMQNCHVFFFCSILFKLSCMVAVDQIGIKTTLSTRGSARESLPLSNQAR